MSFPHQVMPCRIIFDPLDLQLVRSGCLCFVMHNNCRFFVTNELCIAGSCEIPSCAEVSVSERFALVHTLVVQLVVTSYAKVDCERRTNHRLRQCR